MFEAERLGIPIDEQDMTRMHIISRKTCGIPFVLRWVMERIREGQTLEWAVESLEHATANDMFGYIFNSSLSLIDAPTRKIFCSMALLPTWTSIETISAMNAGVAAISDRLSDLVKYSLVEDNLKLAPSARRYQLHPFTRYLASKELLGTDDGGAQIVKNALCYYLNNLSALKKVTTTIQQYLEMEFVNIEEVVRVASANGSQDLVDECIQVLEVLKEVDLKQEMKLLSYLIESSRRTSNQKQIQQLLGIIGNPYLSGLPIRDSSMFFGREELLGALKEEFEKNPSSAISITGPRRIGKTSLLYQLRSYWSEKFCCVLLDLQSFVFSREIASLLFEIILQINAELNSKGAKDGKIRNLQPIDREAFKQQPLQAFVDYIRSLRQWLEDVHLVLLIDEFDLLSELIKTDTDGNYVRLLQYLRALVSEGTLGIITAGVRPLYETVADPLKASPFFNIFSSMRIAAISRRSAIELIQKPMSGLLQYDDTSIEYILELSGCLPYQLNVICQIIVQTCLLKGTSYVKKSLIEEILPQVYEALFVVIAYYFNQLTDVEKAILLAAEQAGREEHSSFTERMICKLVPQYTSRKIHASLLSLELLGIFMVDKRGDYGFTDKLFQRGLLEELTKMRADDTGHQVHSNTGEKGASSMSDQKQDKPTITNTTHIGYVAGPTHTGSGDIVIDTLSYEGAISTKEEFLAALRTFKGELEVAHQRGLPEEIYDDTTIEIEAAEREARKDASKPDRVINRLEKAKALLTVGTSVAAATTSLVETSSKLVPLIEAAIQAVGKIFS